MTTTLSIETPQGKRCIGHIEEGAGRKVLCKNVQKSKHLHRTLNAWAVDAKALNELPPEVSGITVFDMDEQKTYRTDIETFREKAVKRDYGYGLQCFLPLRYWQTEDSEQFALFAL